MHWMSQLPESGRLEIVWQVLKQWHESWPCSLASTPAPAISQIWDIPVLCRCQSMLHQSLVSHKAVAGSWRVWTLSFWPQQEAFQRPLDFCMSPTSWPWMTPLEGSLFISLQLWAVLVLGSWAVPWLAESLMYLGVSASPSACTSNFHCHLWMLCWMRIWCQVTLCPERYEKTGFNIQCNFFLYLTPS